MTYYSEEAHGDLQYDGIAEALRENEMARESFARTDQIVPSKWGNILADNLDEHLKGKVAATASFAEAYERKGIATFDSYAMEGRNESYNTSPEEIVVSLTYVFTKGEDDSFEAVKSIGEGFKAAVTQENRENRRRELQEQLNAARESITKAEKELAELDS